MTERAWVRTLPAEFAAVVDALIQDDTAALRSAAGAIAATSGERTPRIAAVRGAIHLELATRAAARSGGRPGDGTDDLTASITLLSAATPALAEPADQALRTRSWWRLAAAYRMRGAAADSERSREAGRNALRGAGQDPRRAARFAGWMLTEGSAAEAFTALEVTATAGRTGSTPYEAITDTLADEVRAVLLGATARVTPPPDVPTREEVAAAIRKLGATALIYLHPTDDAGRTAGVLCLDQATERLDVIANVPVTDPLTSDDPGWPAVLERWTASRRAVSASPRVLVAASGNLEKIALSSVLTSTGRRLAQDVAISYVSSGAQIVELASRPARPVAAEPVHLAGGRVPDAAAATHRAGKPNGDGLVILADSGNGGFTPVAESLIEDGFSGVIGWLWPVPPRFAELALVIVRLMLVDRHRPPALAVNAVHQWMLNPERALPPCLTAAHIDTVETLDLTRPALWAALAYRGR